MDDVNLLENIHDGEQLLSLKSVIIKKFFTITDVFSNNLLSNFRTPSL